VSDLSREVGLSRSTTIGTCRRSPRSATCSRTRRRASTASGRACSTSRHLGDQLDGAAQIGGPHLQQLRDETGPHVNMADPSTATDIVLHRALRSRRATREIDLNLHVGSRLPAYCTSMGKVLLAFLLRRSI
jgi:IclR family pca regulon transcriptional regulator